jgi:hypothetical protein
MQRGFLLLAIAVIVWLTFGAVIGGLSAVILGYTWVIDVITYGAIIGAFVGLGIGLIGLIVAFVLRSREVIIWMIGGSIIGAIIGFSIVIIIGGYPTRTQADLSFISLGPVGLATGGLLGTVVGKLSGNLVFS